MSKLEHKTDIKYKFYCKILYILQKLNSGKEKSILNESIFKSRLYTNLSCHRQRVFEEVSNVSSDRNVGLVLKSLLSDVSTVVSVDLKPLSDAICFTKEMNLLILYLSTIEICGNISLNFWLSRSFTIGTGTEL